MKRKCTMMLLNVSLLLFCIQSKGQVSYTFTRIAPGSISYNELTGDSDVTHSFDGDGLYYLDFAVLGQFFYAFGNLNDVGNNSSLIMGENGFMEIDDLTTSSIFDAGFTYLDSVDSTSRKSFSVTGVHGSRIVKLQYKNWRLSNGPGDNYINYQIWLYQQDGVIEFHYGGRSADNICCYSTTAGPNVGVFWTPSDFTGCLEKLWCTVDPNNPTLDSVPNYQFDALQGMPDSGTVYRFTPVTAVGINEVSNAGRVNVNIFPKLASEKVMIEIKGYTESTMNVAVTDALGRNVKVAGVTPGMNELNISELQDGIYFISVNTGKENVTTKIVHHSLY